MVNDIDFDGNDIIIIGFVDNIINGKLEGIINSFIYIFDENFSGLESFIYIVVDSEGLIDIVNVIINVIFVVDIFNLDIFIFIVLGID